jgi:16S rRNA processing protein RimM
MRNQRPEPRYLAIGRVLRPHGVRGEVRVQLLTAHPEHLADVRTLYVGDAHRPHTLLSVRPHKNLALILLQGYEGRDAADALRGEVLYVGREDAISLDEGEVYEYQLEGLSVVTDEGTLLGEVAEVITAPNANDVLIVHGPFGELLIPVIEDVIVACDLDAAQITVHLLPGLIPDH